MRHTDDPAAIFCLKLAAFFLRGGEPMDHYLGTVFLRMLPGWWIYCTPQGAKK
jgi:hypothetical protein